jgi:signal transduction histidine kinase
MHNTDPSSAAGALRSSLELMKNANLPAESKAVVEAASQQLEQVEAELNMLAASLQESKLSRAKFVSVVTHELRLPLTSIKGYTDLLRQGVVGPVNDKQKDFLIVVRTNVDRMSALISDLSDMSHLQTGRLKLLSKPIALQDLINSTILPFKSRFEEKKQKLEVILPEDLVQIIVDSPRLEQVLSYLLSNANKYTPPEGQISLRAKMEGDKVRIEISDTGIGIKPEDRTQLFSPFFRSEDEAVREHQGWGLALHVAKLLVDLMDGEIGVVSEYQKGSTFWIEFPCGL